MEKAGGELLAILGLLPAGAIPIGLLLALLGLGWSSSWAEARRHVLPECDPRLFRRAFWAAWGEAPGRSRQAWAAGAAAAARALGSSLWGAWCLRLATSAPFAGLMPLDVAVAVQIGAIVVCDLLWLASLGPFLDRLGAALPDPAVASRDPLLAARVVELASQLRARDEARFIDAETARAKPPPTDPGAERRGRPRL